ALLRQFEWQQDMRRHADTAASGGEELAWLREQLQILIQPLPRPAQPGDAQPIGGDPLSRQASPAAAATTALGSGCPAGRCVHGCLGSGPGVAVAADCLQSLPAG